MAKINKENLLYWLPRILGILLVIFITLFALDVFSAGYKFPEILIALGMHLIPTVILIIATAIAWKWHAKGGLLFIVLGLLYILLAWGEKPLIAYFTISGPSFVTGALFLADGKKPKKFSAAKTRKPRKK